MADTENVLLVAVCDGETEPRDVKRILHRRAAERIVEIEDAAIVHRKDGKVRIRHASDLRAAGAAAGGLWGTFVGLLVGGPAAAVVAGALSAAGGALVGRLRDIGIDDDFIRELGEALSPGNSAFVALIRGEHAERALDGLEFGDAKVMVSLIEPKSDEEIHEVLERLEELADHAIEVD